MKDITDVYYENAKWVCKEFGTKNLGEYHDPYVHGNTLFLTDIFKSVRDISLKTYQLDAVCFFLHLD